MKRVAVPYAPYVLVVDDDPQVRELFRRILENAGYLVSVVGSGRQALRECGDRTFDLAITDLSLPDMDGLDLIDEILRELPECRVLVVSGFAPAWLLSAAQAVGACDIMQKPDASRELLVRVCRLLVEAD